MVPKETLDVIHTKCVTYSRYGCIGEMSLIIGVHATRSLIHHLALVTFSRCCKAYVIRFLFKFRLLSIIISCHIYFILYFVFRLSFLFL